MIHRLLRALTSELMLGIAICLFAGTAVAAIALVLLGGRISALEHPTPKQTLDQIDAALKACLKSPKCRSGLAGAVRRAQREAREIRRRDRRASSGDASHGAGGARRPQRHVAGGRQPSSSGRRRVARGHRGGRRRHPPRSPGDASPQPGHPSPGPGQAPPTPTPPPPDHPSPTPAPRPPIDVHAPAVPARICTRVVGVNC